MDFNILEFKFAGALPWTFPPIRICLFLSKVVKTFHFSSELWSSALEHARLHATSVPIYTDGSKSSEVWAMPLFFLILMYSSLPVVASILTVELCAIYLSLFRISFHESNNFVIYLDSRSAMQALGSFYTWNSLVMKILRFLCDLHSRRKCVSCWIPSHVGCSGNEKAGVLTKRAIQLPPANHSALPLQDYVPSLPPGIFVWTNVLRMTRNCFSWNFPLVHGLLVPSGVAVWKFPCPVSVSVIFVLHTVIWWLVRFLLFVAVIRFAFRFSMWLNALVILCPVIGFSLPWRQCLPVSVCLFSSPSLLLIVLRHLLHF